MDRAALQERFGIVGSSRALHHVLDRVRLVARADISVLIEGESGVGKELIAHAIHELSPRRHKALVVVNCGAIPEGLIESELFGAEKGAYTGAVERRTGYFEEADGGTIFLDEIGEMPLAAQVRLLRVLETGEFSRVGASATRRSDARVIAATNKDLGREVEVGRFREDLYYRLSTVVIRVPPLRERAEDILPLFEHFLHRFTQKYNAGPRRLDASARELLGRYAWPGNVRELRNLAEQTVVLVPKPDVGADDLRPHLRGVTAAAGLVPAPKEGRDAPVGEGRAQELIYRALLEMRLEMRELKEQMRTLAEKIGSGGIAVPRTSAAETALSRGDYVIVRDPDRDAYAALIEDVPYEIAADEAAPDTDRSADRAADRPAERDAEPADDPLVLLTADAELPTIEDAERRLIVEALRRFDGNRRQTANALGISERTLYRKLKEIEVE